MRIKHTGRIENFAFHLSLYINEFGSHRIEMVKRSSSI